MKYQLTGASVFQYISFRAAISTIFSMGFSLFFGRRIINFLRKQQIGETIRDLGLDGQKEKEGTPTMGGLIIILSTLLPVILLARLNNIYIILLMTTMIWMGFIGWLDDYIKVFKKNKKGLKRKFKLFGQVVLGVFVGTILFILRLKLELMLNQFRVQYKILQRLKISNDIKAAITTIPLLKNNEFNYYSFIKWIGVNSKYTWLIFIPIVVFIMLQYQMEQILLTELMV